MRSKVLIIVIDGCRPDGIKQADTPAIDALIGAGAHTFNAQTVSPPITLPAHFSIFTSRKPIGHGVTINSGCPSISPEATSLFELARYHDLTCAAFYSWEHLRNLAPPGVMAESHLIDTLNNPNGDREIAALAAERIIASGFDLCFVYLEGTDQIGHRHGWMSASYLKAVATADHAVGLLRQKLDSAGLLDQYTTLLLADHGGLGTHHMDAVPEVMTIPFIIQRPAINSGINIAEPVSVLDVAPTTAYLLNIRPHWLWEGKVLSSVMA